MGWEAFAIQFFIELLMDIVRRGHADADFKSELSTRVSNLISTGSVEEAQSAAKELQTLLRSK